MAVSKAQQKAVAKYEAKAYDKVLLRMAKGQLDIIKEHAKARGESVNGYINRSVEERMEREPLCVPEEKAVTERTDTAEQEAESDSDNPSEG